jgi:hypothetical protein
MAKQSLAQFYVVDPAAGTSSDVGNLSVIPLQEVPLHHAPLEVSEMPQPHELPEGIMLPEEHQHPLEVNEPGEIAIVIDDIPGAPHSKDPEPELEVSEEPLHTEDQNEAAKPKKDPKWDWEAHGPHGFIAWIKSRCDDVPKHSGQDTAGLERAMAYLDKLDGEISRAMRMDLDGELDANQIEKVRVMIDEGISRLHDRLDKIKKVKKTNRSKKKTSELEVDEQMIKEAQKIMGVGGVVVVADLLTSRVAKVCINGMVSAGHDINDLYFHQVKEYNLNKREQACVRELLECMGYTLREDRGHMPEDDVNYGSSDNFDFSANFWG